MQLCMPSAAEIPGASHWSQGQWWWATCLQDISYGKGLCHQEGELWEEVSRLYNIRDLETELSLWGKQDSFD